MHFLTKSRNFDTGHGGGAILNTDICLRAKKIEQNRKQT